MRECERSKRCHSLGVGTTKTKKKKKKKKKTNKKNPHTPKNPGVSNPPPTHPNPLLGGFSKKPNGGKGWPVAAVCLFWEWKPKLQSGEAVSRRGRRQWLDDWTDSWRGGKRTGAGEKECQPGRTTRLPGWKKSQRKVEAQNTERTIWDSSLNVIHHFLYDAHRNKTRR